MLEKCMRIYFQNKFDWYHVTIAYVLVMQLINFVLEKMLGIKETLIFNVKMELEFLFCCDLHTVL